MVAEPSEKPEPGSEGVKGGGSYFDGFLNFVGNPNFPPGRPNMNPRVQGYEAGPYSGRFATSPRGWEPPVPSNGMQWELNGAMPRRSGRRPGPFDDDMPSGPSGPRGRGIGPIGVAPSWEDPLPGEDEYTYKTRIDVGRMKRAEQELRGLPGRPIDWDTALELAAQNISGKYPGMEAWSADADAQIARAREEQAMRDLYNRTVTPMSFDLFARDYRALNPPAVPSLMGSADRDRSFSPFPSLRRARRSMTLRRPSQLPFDFD